MLSIQWSVIDAFGPSLGPRVAEFQMALAAHAQTVGVAAPIEEPLVEMIARAGGMAAIHVVEPPPPAAIRVIRSLAFRLRLPEARRAAITAAALAAVPTDGGAAMTFLLDQASSVTTDLDDPRVADGVASLRAAGVITPAEAQALLADGTPEEVR